MRTDQEIATEIKETISYLAGLFNEAKKSNIIINFNIAETDVMLKGKAIGKKFQEITIIQKIETL